MFSGVLRKMNTDLGTSVAYYLNLNNDFVAMHQFIDQSIKIEMTGYECLNCSSSECANDEFIGDARLASRIPLKACATRADAN